MHTYIISSRCKKFFQSEIKELLLHVVAGYAWLLSWGLTTWNAREGRCLQPQHGWYINLRNGVGVYGPTVLVLYEHVNIY